jgi:hypothetical protein
VLIKETQGDLRAADIDPCSHRDTLSPATKLPTKRGGGPSTCSLMGAKRGVTYRFPLTSRPPL